jgi:hypothetical protein
LLRRIALDLEQACDRAEHGSSKMDLLSGGSETTPGGLPNEKESDPWTTHYGYRSHGERMAEMGWCPCGD